MKCEGACDEHRGEVRKVTVTDPDVNRGGEWGTFWYCETAIEDDRRNGFIVEFVGLKMNGKDIIIEWLKEHGFDGLCMPDEECGCQIDDLVPCDSSPCLCQPGKKRMRDDGDWVIETSEGRDLREEDRE